MSAWQLNKRRQVRPLAILIAAAFAGSLQSLPAQDTGAAFDATVQPFMAAHCFSCHNADLKTSNLDLTGFRHAAEASASPEVCIAINRYEVEQFAHFIAKLKATEDGDGTLFDHSMVTYGSGLSRDHDHDNLPPVVIGRGNGLFQLGKHIKYPAETPLANLHVAMMNQMGVPAEHFADSTGKLGYLAHL